MRNSTLNNLLLRKRNIKSWPAVLLFAASLGFSCSVTLFPGYRNAEDMGVNDPITWFQCDSCQYVYKTTIDVLKNHFSGLMVMKAMDSSTHRVVMITEVGLKIFDLEFSHGKEPVVHYIMEPLNRKMLIKTLKNDIGLLIADYSVPPKLFVDKHSGDVVYRYKYNGKKNDYLRTGKDKKPYSIRQSKGIVNKVNVQLFAGDSERPDSIKLSHTNSSLRINLYSIKEESKYAD